MCKKYYFCPEFLNTKANFMNKKTLLAALLLAASTQALAGDYLTNTNHSASFLRMPAQEGYISIEGAYYNPAGIGFLPAGWHFALNNQTAFQTRTPRSTFGLFANRMDGNGGLVGSTTNKYKGTAVAPIIPALDVAYVSDGPWFGSFHFGVIGGGGKCEFDNGLGSFESIVSAVPLALNMLTGAMGYGNVLTNEYDMNTYMRGKQFYFGAQVSVGYKINENLSVSLGGRLLYASSNYYGYVRDIKLKTAMPLQTPQGVAPAGTVMGAENLLGALATTMMAANPGDPATMQRLQGLESFGKLVGEVEVNCDQTGWGFSPIIGIDYKNGPLNIGARYEFGTRLRLKNRSTTTAEQAAVLRNLAEYEDGKKVPGDMPGMLGVGVGYEFTPRLRANLAGHLFFDKSAKMHDNKQDLLKANTWEILAGVEYDITDRLTASLGGQTTNYGIDKEKNFLSDISFTSSSYSLGAGVKFKISDKIGLNLAYFKTFYYSSRKHQQDYNHLGSTMGRIVNTALEKGVITQAEAVTVQNNMAAMMQANPDMLKGNDLFDRTNDVIGIGIDIHL